MNDSNDRLERIEAAIRDLAAIGRTCINSIMELQTVTVQIREQHERDYRESRQSLDRLTHTQRLTEDKLNILIDTVDRIVRRGL